MKIKGYKSKWILKFDNIGQGAIKEWIENFWIKNLNKIFGRKMKSTQLDVITTLNFLFSIFQIFFSDSCRKLLEKYFEYTYFESLVVGKKKIVQVMKREIIVLK